MPLAFPRAPAAVAHVFRDGLAELIEACWVPTGLPIGRPLEVWVLDVRHLLNEKANVRRDAKLVQWQCLVGNLRSRRTRPRRRGRVFAVDVACPRGSKAPCITGLERGSHVGDVFEEVKDLQKRPWLKSGRYTLRRLRIPVLASVFWLRSSGNAKDYVVPYHSATRKLTRMRIYRMEKFLAILKPLAEKSLKGIAPSR
jgi:hypothetical protein